MAGPPEDWRLPEKRNIIIKKLEEAYSSSGNLNSAIQQTPQQLEQAFYEKSKNREEYNRYLQQVLLRLARAGGRRPGQMQQPGLPQGMGQAGGTMLQQGGGMGMNPQGPSYNQSQYSQYPGGGMRAGSMQGGDMGMGGMMQPGGQQPPGYGGHYPPRPGGGMVHPSQPFNQMRAPNQQQMYGQGPMVNQASYGGMPPRYNMHPGGMMSGGMTRGQAGMQPRPNQGVPGMGMGRPNMGMNPNPSSSFSGVHSVQAISNPGFTQTQGPGVGMQPSSRPEGPPTSGPMTSSSGNDQQSGGGAKEQQIGNPPTPHPPSMQGGVPSPAPPTPLLPASPATSVGSPAQQPSITPEENEVYMRKLAELQKYIPLLQKWITKLAKEDKNNQLPKLKQLYSLLSSSNKRVPITTLMRCGEALDKMFNNDQSSRESHSSLSDPATPQATPHAEPVVPVSKLVEPHHSPSLLEFKRVPSPPSNYESLLGAIHTRPLPPERLPPSKRMCNRDEPSIPFGLTRELATVSNVKVKQLPNENKFDKSTILQCTLDDDGLCSVPPLKVRIPSSYPLVSPVCDLAPYHSSTTSTLVTEVGRTLSERLSRSVHTYSLSSLLSDWEMCVLRAMAKQLSTPSL